jgi:hypothetical protein
MRHFPSIALLIGLCLGSGTPAQDSSSEALTGTWDDVTPERETHGYRAPRPKISVTFSGTAFTSQEVGGPVFRQSLFVLGKSDPHHLIDFVTVDGGVFYTTRGRYQIEGDTLTIKEGAIEQPRPTDLAPDDLDRPEKRWAPVYTYKRRAR